MNRGITLAVLLAFPAFAGSIGYAQATGYFKKDSRPTLYQPLNLLDGRDNTAWCSPTGDTLNDHLSFGFKNDETISELRITNGNNFSNDTWAQFGHAKKLEIKGPKGSKSFELEDKRGPQVITFDPPLAGSRFTIEILDQFPAEDPDSPVCITDVIFVAGGKPMNGTYLGTKLKYDKSTATVMGTWYAGYEDKPDRFLSFFFDGTFRYSYEPFDTQKYQPKDVVGEYDVSPGRMTFQIGKAKKSTKMNLDKNTKTKKGGDYLVFEGELPEDLKQTFRSIP